MQKDMKIKFADKNSGKLIGNQPFTVKLEGASSQNAKDDDKDGIIYLKDLKDECFVSTPHAERGGLSYLVANLCLAAGFTSQKAPILSRKVSQLQLVAANLGISIVPEEFKQILPNQVKLLPLADDLSRAGSGKRPDKL